jgi:hypothetical protein
VRGDGGEVGKGILEMLESARQHYENRTVGAPTPAVPSMAPSAEKIEFDDNNEM